jgi:hypothetical protein
MTGPGFCNHGISTRRLVHDALQILDTTIVAQLAIYTGLTSWQVQGALRKDRYTWCDLVDSVSSDTGFNDVGVWQFCGPEKYP